MEWRPIESAPRDGTRIALSMRDVDREPPEWHGAYRVFSVARPYRWSMRSKTSAYWMADDGLVCSPTHWMPLPTEGGGG